MNNLHSVFWDLDGTIADTELSGHRIAFNKSFEDLSYDINWSKDEYIDLLRIGGGKNRLEFYFKEKGMSFNTNDIQNIHMRKQKHYSDLIARKDITIRRGVIRLINELASKNIKQWIVTTSSNLAVNSLINAYFEKGKCPFNGFVTSDNISKHKPDPEAYILAMEKSGSTKYNSIVIEDSVIGLKAAKAANLKCVITLSPWIRILSNEFREADLVVDHLGDEKDLCNVIIGNLNDRIVYYRHLNDLLNV